MIQLLHTLRSLPTARPSRAVRLATVVLSLTIGVTGFFQAVSHPDGYLPLHIAVFALIILWASLCSTAYRHSVYALCTLILVSSAYYNQQSALLAFFILASTFLFVLTGSLPGIVLLAISHTAGEAITAYALHQPFNSASLIFSLILFIALPLALRISWEQKRTLAQEYATYREQVAESNRALARELHDTVARHISIIGLNTNQALNAPTLETKDAALNTIQEKTHRALADMRLLIQATRADHSITALPEISPVTVNLTESLNQAIASLTRKGFTVDANIDLASTDIPEGVRPTLHKVIQEIRFNAEKYAVPGSTIAVTARPNLTGITISTSNPVPAPTGKKNRSPSTGYGLVGIQERIRRLGGTIRYGVKNQTWQLTINLPLITD